MYVDPWLTKFPPVEASYHLMFPIAEASRSIEPELHKFLSETLGLGKLPTVIALVTIAVSLPQFVLLTMKETVYVPAAVYE